MIITIKYDYSWIVVLLGTSITEESGGWEEEEGGGFLGGLLVWGQTRRPSSSSPFLRAGRGGVRVWAKQEPHPPLPYRPGLCHSGEHWFRPWLHEASVGQLINVFYTLPEIANFGGS